MPTLASYPQHPDDWATVCRCIDQHRPDLAAALAADTPPRTPVEQRHSLLQQQQQGLQGGRTSNSVMHVRYTTEDSEIDPQTTDTEGTAPHGRSPRQDGHQHAA